ncbi:CH [Musa troglodytarum]|uniref:CH n=1 Tax=Musa troglodytarum TaxID=320322 RepID=A0A9E7K9K4_9LILI|nr:CH [Musa troglodytarum]
MDRRRRPDNDAAPPPSPSPSTPSPYLRDVSNFKNPKTRLRNANPNPLPPSSPLPIFFTASKRTPSSSAYAYSRRSCASGAAPSSLPEAARRRLTVLELEQSRSSRKNQERREKALKSFAGSISAWLNFLFKDPNSCGCHIPPWFGDRQDGVASNGKRESLDGGAGLGGRWWSPKRSRDCSLRGTSDDDALRRESAMFSSLKVSLKDVCSLEDMRERMEHFMSKKSCREVLFMMSQVCKSIDEGRLKMKADCPLVTDLGLKEKATRTLMSYNPMWLCVGLHIIFGGDSLLLNEGRQSEKEYLFLKMMIETHFFSQGDIAKSYAYNKLVDGLYRPGYYEALGGIILKRFLLLVASLDKAKCECNLPTKYGIDGVDGGSPLLFDHRCHIKSTQQVINEFLSEVMHGEGNLLQHLLTLGFKVNYQQIPLSEYDFNVQNLFEDIQDGILISRAIQLLQCDASILSKVMAPPDTSKKKLHNCNIALQYLKMLGVSLFDADGTQILAEDIVNGDKELTLSLLWNMFLKLQVPLLIERASLVGEIIKLKISCTDDPDYGSVTIMDLLLEWIQVVCEKYNIKVDGLSSLIDGEALCCLIYYYSDVNFHGGFSSKENLDKNNECAVKRFNFGHTGSSGNLLSVQRIITIMGNFPEVLHISDILGDVASFDERSMIILIVFLASLLVCRNNLDRGKMYCLMRWDWSLDVAPSTSCSSLSENDLFTTLKSQKNKMSKYACPLQNGELNKYDTEGQYDKYMKFMIERHQFIHMKTSVKLIQSSVRSWIISRRHRAEIAPSESRKFSFNREPTCAELESFQWQTMAVVQIQSAWRGFSLRKYLLMKRSAAIKIQSHWRAWYTRTNFMNMVKSVTKIQVRIRGMLCMKSFNRFKFAAIVIQQYTRGQLARNRLLGASSLQSSKLHFGSSSVTKLSKRKHLELKIVICAVVRIQRWWKQVILCRSQTMAVILLQSFIRGWNARKATNKLHHSIITIQRWWRNILFHELRKKSALIVQAHIRGWIARRATSREKHCIVLLQSYWRGYLVRKRSTQQLFNLRCKLKVSDANVEDDVQLINRLVAALSKLFCCKSIRYLRHTCATLSNATQNSEKCCETMVNAGAIDILLKHVRMLNRGIPDQEVIKHVLSTLRNIVCHPLLLQVFIDTPQSGEIIFQEVLRNKNEGFFVACDLLKRLCSTREGRETICKLHGHVRRLNVLAQDLQRKADLRKRRAGQVGRSDITLRRLREAVNLLQLILDKRS